MQRLIVKKLLLTTSALALLLISTPAGAFNPVGSSRVPFQVPDNQNLRDPEYIRVPIVDIRTLSGRPVGYSNASKIKCYYENVRVNDVDNRSMISKFLRPMTPVYKQEHNCYKVPVYGGTFTEGYVVTYEHRGRYFEYQTQTKPHGRFVRIMGN